MARKPSDIVQPNLRIREDLRRRLEKAAIANGVSINREMINRLEASFGQQSLLKLAELVSDLNVIDARQGEALIDRNLYAELLHRADVLVAQIDLQDPKAIAAASTQVKDIIASIERHALLKLRLKAANEAAKAT
jgi:hypothetical protein